jgi:hypothetical protein
MNYEKRIEESRSISELTWNIGKQLKNHGDEPSADLSIEFVEGIDRKNTDYIN